MEEGILESIQADLMSLNVWAALAALQVKPFKDPLDEKWHVKWGYFEGIGDTPADAAWDFYAKIL